MIPKKKPTPLSSIFIGAGSPRGSLAEECGAKLRIPFAMRRRGGGDAGFAPQDALTVPEAFAAGKRVWGWGAGDVAPREEWRRQVEAQVVAPLRVAAALPAPAQRRQAGLAERACLDFLTCLHGPTGRPLLLLEVGEVFPAAP